MDGLDAGLQAPEAAADVHEAGVVPGRADLGLGVEDAPDLVPEHRRRGLRVLYRERPPEPAALLGLAELYEIHPPHVAQELERRIPDLEHPQRVAGRVVGDPVRVVRPDVRDARLVYEEL